MLFSAHLPQRPTIRTIVEDHIESLRREIVKSDSIVEEGDNGGIAQNHHLMRVDQDILLLLGLPYSPEDIYTPKLRSQGSNLEEFHGLETKVPFSTPGLSLKCLVVKANFERYLNPQCNKFSF